MAGDGGRKARLKEMLAENKRRMWNELRDEIFRGLGSEHAGQYDIPHDLGEHSVLDLAEDLGLSLTDIRVERLTAMEEALRKLEQGTYGSCSSCGTEIDEARLRAMPHANLCVRCQASTEGGRKPTL